MIGGAQAYDITYRLKRSHDTVCVNEQNYTEELSSLLGHCIEDSRRVQSRPCKFPLIRFNVVILQSTYENQS